MSAIDADSRPRVLPAHPESIHDLLTRLVGDVFRLLDHELALATAEMKQHVELLARTIILFLAGGLSAAIGLLLLATAAALVIGRTIDSIVGGYLIVGAAITVIGAVVVGMAKSRLTKQSLVPTQTIDEIRRDVTWMTHAGKRRSG
jgi:Putative Actinobacterial Holin-X, holin superfamily III